MKLITCYRVTRLPGGPEEGGWWYDHHELDRERMSVTVEGIDPYPLSRALNAHERRLEKADGEYPMDSVLSAGGHACWLVEDERGEEATTVRPHYE